MKNNYIFPFVLMIGMLFAGFTSFGQSISSLNPEKKKDAAYVQQQQQLINQGVKPEVKAKTAGTSAVSAAPKKDESAKLNTEPATSPNYYNPRSIIFTDERTPRYPLTGDEAQDIANYNKAKQVWMDNNPQQTAKPAMTEQQAAERQQKGK
ncbi:MAG: hypothetical protein AB7G44_00355 [Bacteroidia bacterium]